MGLWRAWFILGDTGLNKGKKKGDQGRLFLRIDSSLFSSNLSGRLNARLQLFFNTR
jgi:hypothetical protein